MKKLLALAFAALFFLGRWDYEEIKNQTIVAGLSVDLTEGGQKLVGFELVKIPGTPEQPIEPVTLTNVGVTIEEALNGVASDISYQLYIGHAWLLMMSEEVARGGIEDIIKLITAHPHYYIATDVAVVRDRQAMDVFDSDRVSSPFISYELNNGFRTDKKYVGKTNPTYAYRIFQMLTNPYEGYLIPALSIIEKDGKKLTTNDGSAIFQQDRLIGFLTPEETQLYLIATGKIEGGEFHVFLDGRPMSLQIKRCNSRIEVAWNGDMPVFTLKLDLELETTLFIDGGEWPGLGSVAEHMLEDGIRALLQSAQAIRCDYLGFAKQLHLHHLSKWNKIKADWPEIFHELDCGIEVHVEVKD